MMMVSCSWYNLVYYFAYIFSGITLYWCNYIFFWVLKRFRQAAKLVSDPMAPWRLPAEVSAGDTAFDTTHTRAGVILQTYILTWPPRANLHTVWHIYSRHRVCTGVLFFPVTHSLFRGLWLCMFSVRPYTTPHISFFSLSWLDWAPEVSNVCASFYPETATLLLLLTSSI